VEKIFRNGRIFFKNKNGRKPNEDRYDWMNATTENACGRKATTLRVDQIARNNEKKNQKVKNIFVAST